MIIRDTHTIPAHIQNMRLSDYVRIAFPEIPSRKGAAKALKRGEILIDGAAAQSGIWVEPGQILQWIDLQQRPPKTFHLKLEVIQEDDDLAIINKPPGFEVSGNKFKTIENALSCNLAPSRKADALPWPRPVHRLDYSTSGLLLVAKTASALVVLGQAFEARTIHKRYRAVVSGLLSEEGRIDEAINGTPSSSSFIPRTTVRSLRSDHLTLVDLFPVTGRTHQLRIHMASLGHPIVGDQKYGQEDNVLKGKGLFLASVELEFPHPATGKKTTVSIDHPAKFDSLLEREKSRWIKFNPSPPSQPETNLHC